MQREQRRTEGQMLRGETEYERGYTFRFCVRVCVVVAGLACRARVLHMHDGCAGGRAYTCYFIT